MSFATVRTTGPLRLILVGAGAMGREWARTIAAQPDTELVAWVDVVPDLAVTAAADLGLATVPLTGSLTEALERVEADAVVDVTVPEAHHAVTVDALVRGFPVLGEKPLAASMAQARSMVAAADDAGQLFMVSQNRRYDAGLHRFRHAIAQVTPLGLLTASFFLAPRFGGFRDRMADPLLLDMAIHAFDAARFLTGAEPVALWCDAFNPPWSWYAGNAAAVVSVELSDGSRFAYTGAWCAEGRPTSWNAEWRAVGAGGTASWDGEHQVTLDRPADEAPVEPAWSPDGPQLPQGLAGALDEFVTALRTGRTPMGECHDNIRSLAMVHAAVQSARAGVRVSLADVLAGPHPS